MISKRLVDSAKPVTGLDSIVPSTSTPDYVSLRDYQHFTAIILVKNATTVTGSAITLKQATSAAAGGEKPLAFSTVWANVDTAAGDALTKTAVVSDTFTTDSTDNKKLMYVIEVDASELDTSNGFNFIRVGTGNATAATVTVLYVLSSPRYAQATPPTAIA